MRFSKYHGAGNDFILIDDQEETFPVDRVYIAQLCHRRFGIGADGLILYQSGSRARIFNADGSEVALCVNGLRCLTHFRKMSEVVVFGRTYRVERDAIFLAPPLEVKLHLKEGLHFADVGVPHAVLFGEKIDFETVAPKLRVEMESNVNVAHLLGKDRLAIRTFERGVGETLACGSGTFAVSWIAHELGLVGQKVEIECRGGMLRVDLKKRKLSGPSVKVFEGEI